MRKALLAFALCAGLLEAGEKWPRGIDELATGTFYERASHAYGLAVTAKVAPKAWPALCFYRGTLGRDLHFGEVRIPGQEQVVVQVESTDWCVRRYAYRSPGGAVRLTVNNLFPSILIESASTAIRLFANAQAYQAEPPSHMAVPVSRGLRTLRRGRAGARFEGAPSEPYILVWFRDAKGFKDGEIPGVHGAPRLVGVDSPWIVLLQHRPERIALSEEGLTVRFGSQGAGFLQAMPLYGIRKLRREETATWQDKIPDAAIQRCRDLAAMSRFYPVYCEERYQVDPGTKDVRIRQSFQYLDIKDAWGIRGKRIAPLPPATGICLTFGRRFSLPVEVRPAPADLAYYTMHGPLLACDGSETVLTFKAGFKYVDEALEITPGKDEISRTVTDRLNRQVRSILDSGSGFRFLSSSANYQFFRFGGRSEQVFSLCQALPLVREELRIPLKKHVKGLLEEHLRTAKWQQSTVNTRAGSLRRCRLLPSQSRAPGEEDLYNGLTLSALWAYAHYTGDWSGGAELHTVVRNISYGAR